MSEHDMLHAGAPCTNIPGQQRALERLPSTACWSPQTCHSGRTFLEQHHWSSVKICIETRQVNYWCQVALGSMSRCTRGDLEVHPLIPLHTHGAEVLKTCKAIDLIDVRSGGACKGTVTELMVRPIKVTCWATQVKRLWNNNIGASLRECRLGRQGTEVAFQHRRPWHTDLSARLVRSYAVLLVLM